ncbi:CAP domain-containing protein [Trichoderma austrokoningii]
MRLLFFLYTLILSAGFSSSTAIVTITAAPAIPSNVPSYSISSSFTSAILNSTNTYRRQHNASSLSWNTTLEKFATSYLQSDTTCDFAHSGGPYGENLAIGYPNATASVEAWGNEVAKYDFNDPGFAEETGHFTQLVWKTTTTVGCGRKLCGTKGWFVVCEYWPRGNVGGEYAKEVDRSIINGGGGAGLNAPATAAVAIVMSLLECGAIVGVIWWLESGKPNAVN